MSPVQRFAAKVAHVAQLTHDVRQIDFHLTDPETISFKAGQFISFEVPDSRIGRPVTRPYSIASSPADAKNVSLLLNLVQGGPGSNYLFRLNEGDSVTFAGPAGNFYLRDDTDRELLFIATGTGIAPIRSMILLNAERERPRPMRLYWGLRTQRDLYYVDELASLIRRDPEGIFVPTLSRPEAEWTGRTGRVTQLVEELADVKNLEVYLCGSSGMIKDVTARIQTKGLCPIFREKYYDDANGETIDGRVAP
ncbi:putative FMN reductase [Nitrospira sp. KM1]|uniref:FAD-binding oxidoreductase n=1 Tax=Nitrospira sp. KM1 TaxID=1936990 RepID=UPI0013A74FA3|nr:FAD-binding oxidoreductase [Nitrospira sp. KM1]BCA54424.1 putative FMN reductase [Nitrospira sp. KM1]